MNILIIDDEKLIQKSLFLIAKTRGHQARVASNGKEALEVLKNFQADLLFLDVLMPEMDGFTFLKNLSQIPKPKIIMFSAHDELDQKQVLQAGVDLFIKKPFDNIYSLITSAEQLIADFQNLSL